MKTLKFTQSEITALRVSVRKTIEEIETKYKNSKLVQDQKHELKELLKRLK